MGPLKFVASSHSNQNARNLKISDESEVEIKELIEKESFQIIEEAFDLGEVSFHCGWLYHGAGENKSNIPREVMTIIYMDKNMRLSKPQHQNQWDDYEAFCKPTKFGEIIETEKNKIIWEKKSL
jgi:ectoine hydroxylase-related dioxygenase (phytanoyl-CoA dioxygenase family)